MRESGPGGIFLVEPPLDPEALARRFEEEDLESEFCVCPSFEPDLVAALAGAGFIPMAAELGEGLEVLLPKLHRFRCVLDPALTRVTRTARREARDLVFSMDGDLPAVLAACVATHGEGWLRPPLVEALLAIAAGGRGIRVVSFELRRGAELVAGDFGVLAGSCYTSWSGFRREAGSGTVQLAALGGALARAGFTLWDLGMEMDYKFRLGAASLSRSDFLAAFRAARALEPRPGLAFLPLPARELLAGAGRLSAALKSQKEVRK